MSDMANLKRGGFPCRATTLVNLINERGWRRGAEVGVWKGYTTRRVLKHCPNLRLLVAVDLWDQTPGLISQCSTEPTIEAAVEAEAAVRALMHTTGRCRLKILKMDSKDAATKVGNAELDFVFIDAEHSAAAVMGDYRAWCAKVKRDGVMLGHDIHWPSVQEGLAAMGVKYRVHPANIWEEISA